jgi:endoglucanase
MAKYGGNFVEVIFPNNSHDTWYSFWQQPNFWPFVNKVYSSNPWPLFAKTKFWIGQPINTTLGLTPGFESYEWRRNGVLLPGNGNEILVTTTGVYDARVRKNGVWSEWSHVPVKIISANTYRKEAEDWANMSGVQTENTTDVGGGQNVGWIEKNDWMDYTLGTQDTTSMPAPYFPGTYTVNLRVAAIGSGAQFEIRNSDSVVLATVNVPQTGGWQTWQTVSVDIPLKSGIQNLRIKSISTTNFNINWMDFTMKAAQSSLPVKFEYISSECKGGGVMNVKWRTSAEQNTDRFSVQRSVDGVNWSEIGSVAAAGQSSVERSYVFADRTAGATNLYRVVEYDYNGQTTISSIVRGGCGIQSEVRLYPNPSKGSSALSIPLSQASSVRLQVMDSKGAVVQQKQIMLPAGNNTVPIDVSKYAEGVYSVQVQYNNQTKTIKLIKQ